MAAVHQDANRDADRDADQDIAGDWFGALVHSPSRGVIHVSFSGEYRLFTGKWRFPSITSGAAKKGAFSAIRFANSLQIRITTKPLADVQFQLTLHKHKNKSMITGVIPLESEGTPFATVTLFRDKPSDAEMAGICPVLGAIKKVSN